MMADRDAERTESDMANPEDGLTDKVPGRQAFLVGHRYHHHAKHSGYEGFQRYVGHPLRPFVNFRFLKFKTFPLLGWRIDNLISKVTGRQFYSLGLLLNEIGVALHMLSHREALYHVLYGDTDVWLLGRIRYFTKTRVVATFHEAPEGLEYMHIDQQITNTLDGVILVSESQHSHFRTLLPAERIFIVPHGVDTSFFRPPKTARYRPICITVGGHLRDFTTLTHAIDLLHQQNPDVRFFAVGTDHGHEGEPFDNARVEFFSGIGDEELRDLYQEAVVAVFCFKQATANNSMLEAMACGLPVVATDVGGVREYLGDDAGILCPPSDPEAIVDGVLRVLGRPAVAAKMGAAGRRRALALDFRSTSRQMSEVYAQVCAMDPPNSQKGI